MRLGGGSAPGGGGGGGGAAAAPAGGAPPRNPFAYPPEDPSRSPSPGPPVAPPAHPYAYPPDAPPWRDRRALVAVGTTLAVAVLGAVAVAGWLYLGGAKGPDTSGPAPRSSSTEVRDTVAGFAVRIPEGWQASPGESAYGTVYRPAGGDQGAGLQIVRAAQDSKTACETLVDTTGNLSAHPGYREISRQAVNGDGCEQVYAYDDPASTQPAAHGIVRLVVAADDTRWVLNAFGPDTDVPLVREHLTTAAQSFRVE